MDFNKFIINFDSIAKKMFSVLCGLFLLPARSSASSLPILTVAAEMIPPYQQLSANHGPLLRLLGSR